MPIRLLFLLLSMSVLLPSAMGCSTVIRPTRPSIGVLAEGPALQGVRFENEEIQIREPGMPVSPSRTWQREVSSYTAQSLNTLLATSDDAPVAHTIVTFDLASPSTFQIGTWKEMSIGLTSTLPDGTVVKSPFVVEKIDDNVEYALVTAMGVGGSVLNVAAGVASIFFFFVQPTPITGIIFIGALLGGLTLSIGESVGQYVIAGKEEIRWSDLYVKALTAHAKDVRAQIGRGPPVQRVPQLPTFTPPLPPPPPLTTAPKPTAPPPPGVIDPSDAPPAALDPSE